MNPTCIYCRESVDPNDRAVWRRIQGWERKASSASSRAGGSDISMRETTGEFACALCITRLKTGITPGQTSLL